MEVNVNIALTFNGNCEQAFQFYKSVFGGEFSYMGRYKEMPAMEGFKPVTGADGEKIMHIALPIHNKTMLMGNDALDLFGRKIIAGNNFSISVTAFSREEADRIFNALSARGMVLRPMENMFWGDYYGILEDKFGINWMVSFHPAK